MSEQPTVPAVYPRTFQADLSHPPSSSYCPLTTPFLAGSEELDLPAWNTQVLRLAQAGMGLVLLGTNGEGEWRIGAAAGRLKADFALPAASHLADEERTTLISEARKTLDSNGFQQTPLLVGTGAGSAHQTIKLCKQAKEAGADYAIVIAPGYFAFAMGKNTAALKDFFVEVIEASPIPVMIYNFPGAASGIDLSSDFLIELSELPNCFGAKLTCAGIGKGHRLAAHTQSEAYLARHAPFQVLPGFSDYLLPALVSRHTGSITGTGEWRLESSAWSGKAHILPSLVQETSSPRPSSSSTTLPSRRSSRATLRS